jgi:hypothetical protein
LKKLGLVQAGVLSASLLASTGAFAAPRITIVVQQSRVAQTTEFETRLRAELLGSGFEVLTVADPATAVTPANLEAAAERTAAAAAIAIDQPADSVTGDVWVTERVTGKTLLRHLRAEPGSTDAPSVFALRAVELLRASLLELNEAHPPRGSVPAEPALRAWVAPSVSATPEAAPAAPRRPTVSVTMGASVFASPGGLPAGLGPTLLVAWTPVPKWFGEIAWSGPANRSIDDVSGTVNLYELMAVARVRFDPLPQGAKIRPFAVTGFGAYRLGVNGIASGDNTGADASVWAGLGLLGAGLRLQTGESVGLHMELDVFATTTRPVIVTAASESYTGRPGLLGTGGVELRW